MVYAYLHELTYPMKKAPNQLLTFKTGSTDNHSKKSTFRQAILPYCKNYCNVSSMHCFDYLTDIQRSRFERIIWLLLLIATTCCCIYVYSDMALLYQSQRIETVVQNSMSHVFTKPFPSIGICPRNRINWPKLLKSDQLFLPSNASAEAIHTFRQFFSIASAVQFDRLLYLQPLMELNLDLSLLDDVDISRVMRHASFTCDEFFEQPCFWRQISYNCCDLFSFERTENGFCYVFNSLVTEQARERQRNDRYYPYHNSKIASRSGLFVVVNIDISKQQPNYTGPVGVNVMVKQPEQWHSTSRFIRVNTDSIITVNPQYTITDERTRAVTPEERNCLFQDEDRHPLYKRLPGLSYRLGNCFTHCRQSYALQYCKCNLDLFFPHDPSGKTTTCKAKDFKCFYEYRDLFKSDHHLSENKYIFTLPNDSMICDCLSSCNQLIYVTNFINSPWEDSNITGTSMLQQIRLSVHYASPYMMTYCTRLRYTFVELLANFGGIMGFFLGASLISCVELVYYFTIGLYMHLRESGFISDGCLSSRDTGTKGYLRKKNLSRRGEKVSKCHKKTPRVPYLRH